MVDSLQRAHSDAPLEKTANLQAKENANVRALQLAANVDDNVIIATSELAKVAYRNKAPADDVTALSAFEESGDLEYGVSLAVVLTSRQGSSEIVDAAVVNNRLEPGKPEFLLRLVHDRANRKSGLAAAHAAGLVSTTYGRRVTGTVCVVSRESLQPAGGKEAAHRTIRFAGRAARARPRPRPISAP